MIESSTASMAISLEHCHDLKTVGRVRSQIHVSDRRCEDVNSCGQGNELFGLWATEKLGKVGTEADAYAKEVVSANFEEAGDNDVFRNVRTDFDAAGVAQSDHQMRGIMDELLVTAVDQIRNG
jgi:hypothetical protein